jgi:hypothetical protein
VLSIQLFPGDYFLSAKLDVMVEFSLSKIKVSKKFSGEGSSGWTARMSFWFLFKDMSDDLFCLSEPCIHNTGNV